MNSVLEMPQPTKPTRAPRDTRSIAEKAYALISDGYRIEANPDGTHTVYRPDSRFVYGKTALWYIVSLDDQTCTCEASCRYCRHLLGVAIYERNQRQSKRAAGFESEAAFDKASSRDFG